MGNIKHRTGAIGGGINLSKSKTPHDADIKYDPINDRADSLSPLNQTTSTSSAPSSPGISINQDWQADLANMAKNNNQAIDQKKKSKSNKSRAPYQAPENDAYWSYMMSDQVKVGEGEREEQESQPVAQTGEISGKQLRKKNKIKNLSKEHEALKGAYDSGQKVNENQLFNVEDKLNRKEKRYVKKYGNSPYSLLNNILKK